MIKEIGASIRTGKNNILARLTADLTSHRLVWNYIYMGLYVFIAIYLVLFHADTCGNTAIVSTAGVVSAIFTNVVWSKTIEKRNKAINNGIPKPIEPTKEESESCD